MTYQTYATEDKLKTYYNLRKILVRGDYDNGTRAHALNIMVDGETVILLGDPYDETRSYEVEAILGALKSAGCTNEGYGLWTGYPALGFKVTL